MQPQIQLCSLGLGIRPHILNKDVILLDTIVHNFLDIFYLLEKNKTKENMLYKSNVLCISLSKLTRRFNYQCGDIEGQ